MKPPSLTDFRRIVVKVGSSLLVDAQAGALNEAWLASLADDIARLHGEARDVIVVSSGAIALGRSRLKLPRGSLKLEDSQAAAAVGQIALARTWAEALGRHDITAGQVLLTLGDTEERRRYLNARSTIAKLLEWRSVPVINENDTVATNEIRYGDNDRLAARVATMASADLLVLLSDVDGLYDAPPGNGRDAHAGPAGRAHHAGDRGDGRRAGSDLSRGGMHTKIEAGKIATQGGTHMVISSGRVTAPLTAIAGGRCTWFLTSANPVTARKKWIAGSLETKGAIHIDAGAVAALRRGKQPAAGRGQEDRGRVLARRCRRHSRAGRRDRPRHHRLRRRGCRQDHWPVLLRDHADPRVRRPRRDGASRRPGDGTRLARMTHTGWGLDPHGSHALRELVAVHSRCRAG